MVLDYVNTILNLIQHPVLAAIAGLLGIAGITVSGIINGLRKSVRKYENSIGEMRVIINDQEKRIWQYENLTSKQNKDLELFIKLFPQDDDRLHSVYHMLHNCSLRVAGGRIKDSSNHVSNHKQAISDTFSFLSESSALIARKRLIFIQKYGCARHFTALKLMESLSESIGHAHINSSESTDHAASTFSDEKGNNFDMKEVEFLYDLSAKFHDVNSIDILLAIKILEIEFLTKDNDIKLRSAKLNSLLPELRKIIKLSNAEFSSIFSIIPNTVVAICIANDKSKTFTDEFDFGDQFSNELDRILAEGGSIPELLKFMAASEERYKRTQQPLFETFANNISYQF